MTSRIAIIVIGRNEGDRLRACFESLPANVPVAYVDSGSTDQSLLIAQEYQSRHDNMEIVHLAPPWSAGRARNEGFAWLEREMPAVEFVQFIDADCMLHENWLTAAAAFLQQNREH